MNTKTTITTQPPAPPTEEPIKVGDWFIDTDSKDIYILAAVDGDRVCLVSVKDGNRYTNGMTNITYTV